ncbi:MAG: hypothetical protein GWO24_15965, partial [Akkermansiaceae bacterium]|nr:hypothetical protein [Akkermansiaceae bacterium]
QAKDGITVTFPEWPEAITCGHDIADALFHARDCLAEAIADRMRRGESFPDFVEPEPGQHLVAVDPEDVLTLADPADGGEHGEGEPSDPK